MSSTQLTCQHISQTFDTRAGQIQALDDVSLSVRPGEFVCLVGPSGCGKSTLLKIVAGLTKQTSGTVSFDGLGLGERPRNAMVFQEHGLFPWMSIIDNVAFGLEMAGVPRPERIERAIHFLEQVGLAKFKANYPHELSVGMRQRVAIIRAFLVDPQLLLMDEPFSALDPQTKLVLEEELLRIWKDHQTMVVYVTHDIDEAVILGDRVIVMSGRPGRIREEIPIPLRRPRDLRDRERPETREISWHIWKAIESEVRQSLSMGA